MNPNLEQEFFERDKVVIKQLTQREINKVRLRQRIKIEHKRRIGLTKDEWENGVHASEFDLKLDTDKIANTVMKKLKFPQEELKAIEAEEIPMEEEDCVMVSSESEDETPLQINKTVQREPILVRTVKAPPKGKTQKKMDEIDRALAEIEKAEKARRKRPVKKR